MVRGILSLVIFFAGCSNIPLRSNGKSTLWRVRTPTNTVYLMGSIHILPKSAYPLKPALNQAFADSQKIVFEIDLNRRNQAATESLQAGVYPKGETLSKNLSPQTLDLLKSRLPAFGVALEKIEPMRPWLVSDFLMSLYLSNAGYSSKNGLDMYFYRKAKAAKKPTAGLETVHAQTKPFSKFSGVDADHYLRETLVSFPFTTMWFQQMVRSWQAGDVIALDNMINRSAGDESGFYKTIFDDRNDAWLPAIRRDLRENTNVLIIVGSGHLVGKTGIIARLQSEGYSVEQM